MSSNIMLKYDLSQKTIYKDFCEDKEYLSGIIWCFIRLTTNMMDKIPMDIFQIIFNYMGMNQHTFQFGKYDIKAINYLCCSLIEPKNKEIYG